MLRVVVANAHLPSVTAQDVGRDLYHERQEMVQIIGPERCLKKIAWIFERVPDLFELRRRPFSLIVRRAQEKCIQKPTPAGDVKSISAAAIRPLVDSSGPWPAEQWRRPGVYSRLAGQEQWA